MLRKLVCITLEQEQMVRLCVFGCVVGFFVCLFMVFNATFNNISVISWQSVLLMEKT
jgi:hypothetical protein